MLTRKSIVAFLLLITVCKISAQPNTRHDLDFPDLAKRWDEAVPLGNGMLGALVWQKNSQLRFSLDRADLWDMRPMKGLHRKEFSYQWVMDQVRNKDYGKVQTYFDEPYEQEPAPSKLPGGAIMFNSRNWGAVQSVHLFVNNAVCEVKWANGTILKTFVHATKPLGVFRFENVDEDFEPNLEAPAYQGGATSAGGSVNGDDLSRLGYKQGPVVNKGNSITLPSKVGVALAIRLMCDGPRTKTVRWMACGAYHLMD